MTLERCPDSRLARAASRSSRSRPRIAVLDYSIEKTNPIGSCHLVLLEKLCEEYDFTVFAGSFDNPRPDRIQYVRIPIPRGPLALTYLLFQLLAPAVFYGTRLFLHLRFDLVQSTETYSALGDICYSHFCHRCYLKEHWSGLRTSWRRFPRWLDHRLRSFSEETIYRRFQAVVVPSHGLKRELMREFAVSPARIKVISNPVDLRHFAQPLNFRARDMRDSLGIGENDTVAVFVALGDFQRKGLPFILGAMQSLPNADFKLLVVGGKNGLIAEYRRTAQEMGIASRVCFAGLQRDIRPFLWASDFLLCPSNYEVFSLVTLQAAAAGLPIVASLINGTEEFLVDGVNGLVVACSTEGVRSGIERFSQLSASDRLRMSEAARSSSEQFGLSPFTEQWSDFYKLQLSLLVVRT